MGECMGEWVRVCGQHITVEGMKTCTDVPERVHANAHTYTGAHLHVVGLAELSKLGCVHLPHPTAHDTQVVGACEAGGERLITVAGEGEPVRDFR